VGRLLGTVTWPHVSVELAAEVTGQSTTQRADGAGFSQREFLGSLAGCGLRLPWSICALANMGAVRVVGGGVDVPATANGFVFQAGLRLGLTHPLGNRLRVAVHADGLGLITRGIVTLDALPLWSGPRVAAVLGADLVMRFR
jgi:hypothetical protein